jgi:hypothetical protein
LAAAIADDEARPDREFVALCMAAEIVMIVEDEDASVRPDGAAIKQCRGKPANAAANNYKIIALIRSGAIDAEALAFARECMCDLERPRMLAAHTGERWWIACRVSC